jgi:hypothetical protein
LDNPYFGDKGECQCHLQDSSEVRSVFLLTNGSRTVILSPFVKLWM